jgi:hypothetical protein
MSEHPATPEILNADLAIIGKKGAGKTVAARGMVERLLDEGRRVVVLDPLSSWHGLKAREDGTPGYPIVVIGGLHGDMEIDADNGAALGVFVGKSAVSCVVDVSDLRRPEMVKFCADFLRALYETNRDALWLVLEEADYFHPQGVGRDQAPLAWEVDQIARRGRARGFRLWTITQRPAKLNKDCLSQAATMIVMKLMAPQDRRAVEDWICGNATEDPRAICDSLPMLEVGEGWIWNPEAALLRRVRFPRAKTIDTSFTPNGNGLHLAQPDVSAFRLALALPAVVDREAQLRESFLKGRAEGAREERDRLRQVLGRAMAALDDGEAAEVAQEAADAPAATTVADDPAKAAPGPPVGPRTNDEARRAILDRASAGARRFLDRALDRGKVSLRESADMLPTDELSELVADGLIAYGANYLTPTERLMFPLGLLHR